MQEQGLAINNVTVLRQQRPLLAAFSYALAPGQALVLRGANGCGKSSLLKAIAGLLPLAAGEISFAGARNDELEFRQQLYYQGHQVAIKDALTVRENLELDLGLAGVEAPQLVKALQRWCLWPLRDSLVKTLSAGQRYRVSLARLSLSCARLWLLDEPLTALDQDACAEFCQLLSAHLQDGGMAVLTTHQDLLDPTNQLAARTHTLEIAPC